MIISIRRIRPGTGKEVPSRPEPKSQVKYAISTVTRHILTATAQMGSCTPVATAERLYFLTCAMMNAAIPMMPSTSVELFIPVKVGPHSGR